MAIPAYITPLSYIRGNSTQYIETEVYLRSTDVVRSKWRFEGAAGNVYGCFSGSGENDNFCLYAGSNSTNAYIRYNGQVVRDFKPANGTIHELEQGPDGFFDNGTKLSDFTPATFTCSAPMYIFMLPNSSSYKVTARCYGLRVYRDGAIAYNFIPAENTQLNEVGMWESVNGVWYSNAGTGEFTAGPETVLPLKPLLLKRRRALLGAAKAFVRPDPDESSYLTFEAINNNTDVFFFRDHGDTVLSIEASTDGVNWQTHTPSWTPIATLSAGDKIYFRGRNSGYSTMSPYLHCGLDASDHCYVYGNIMSVIDGDDALVGNYSALQQYSFYEFFNDEESWFGWFVKSHPTRKLVLPATTLAPHCYDMMFYCAAFERAPELPATALVDSCYYQMFRYCNFLVQAPELPATTLAPNCYHGMFSGCTSLNYIKALFTTTPGADYTPGWVYGVNANGTFVKNAAATWNVTGANGIPSGWTVLTE